MEALCEEAVPTHDGELPRSNDKRSLVRIAKLARHPIKEPDRKRHVNEKTNGWMQHSGQLTVSAFSIGRKKKITPTSITALPTTKAATIDLQFGLAGPINVIYPRGGQDPDYRSLRQMSLADRPSTASNTAHAQTGADTRKSTPAVTGLAYMLRSMS